MNIDPNYNLRRYPEIERIHAGIPTLPADKKQEILSKIEDPSDTQFISQKQFALMFGDTFIKDTDLEGGNPKWVAKYYLKELEFWEQNPDLYQGVTAEQIQTIKRDLEDYIEAFRLLIRRETDQLRLFIAEKLNQKGESRVIIPLMTNGLKDLNGHASSIVFLKGSEGTLSFYFLNRGEGSETFPLMRQSAQGKYYRSYCSLTYVLKDPEFFIKNDSIGFVERMVHYATTRPTADTIKLFSTNYLMEDLIVFADKELTYKLMEKDAAFFARIDDLGVTSQRSGTCAEQAVRLLVRDDLVMSDADIDTIKRVMYANKMRGLKNGYHHLPLTDDKDGKINISLLRKAAEGVAVHAAKMKEAGLITSERLKETLILVDEVTKKANKEEERNTHPLLLGDMEDFTVSDVKIPLTEEVDLDWVTAPAGEAKPPEFPSPTLKIQQLINRCLADPNAILDVIVELRTIEQTDPFFEPQDQKLSLWSSFFLSLPVPKYEGEIYWNRLDNKNRDLAIGLLSALGTLLNNYALNAYKREGDKESHYDNIKTTLINKHIAAIEHRLLCDDPAIGVHLKKCGIDTTPKNQDNFKLHFRDGALEAQNHELDAYFEQTQDRRPLTGTPRKEIIFNVWEHPNVKQMLHDYIKYGIADKEWLPTLNLYKECMKSLNLESSEPLDLYFQLLTGDTPHKKFTYLFDLNLRIQTIRENYSIQGLGGETAPRRAFKFNRPQTETEKKEETKKTVMDIARELSEQPAMDRENSALIAALKDQNLAPGAEESLLRILNFQQTRVPLFIDWCRTYWEEIKKPEVQRILELALLNASTIPLAFKQEPETIAQLRAFLDEQMERSKNKRDVFLFWGMLSAHVESRLAKIGDKEVPKRVKTILAFFEKNPFPKKSYSESPFVAPQYHRYIFSLFPEMLEDNRDAFLRLESEILLTSNEEYVDFEKHKIPLWMITARHGMTLRCYDLLAKGDIETELPSLNTYLNLPEGTKWRISYPYATVNDYRVDFIKKKIYQNNAQVMSSPSVIKFSAKDKLIPTDFLMFKMDDKFHRTNESIESEDGSFHYDFAREIATREFEIDGVKEKFSVKLKAREPVKSVPTIPEKGAQWVSLRDPNRLIITDDYAYHPLYAVTLSDDVMTMERLEKGKRTGEFEFPLENTPWKEKLEKLAPDKRIRVFCKQDENHRWQLSRVIIDKLTFEVDQVKGKFRFKSLDMPSYYLSNDQWERGLLQGQTVWLEDATGKNRKAVILPIDKMDAVDGKYDLELHDQLKADNAGKKEFTMPFVYRLDAKKGKAIAETKRAALYQIYLYMNQERYLEAFEVLQTLELGGELNKTETYLLNKIINHRDQSPASVALQLHAVLMQKNASTSRAKISKLWNEDHSFQIVIGKYLKFVGDVNLQRIPEPMRLNPALFSWAQKNQHQQKRTPFSEEGKILDRLAKSTTNDIANLLFDKTLTLTLTILDDEKEFTSEEREIITLLGLKSNYLLMRELRNDPSNFSNYFHWLYRRTGNKQLKDLHQQFVSLKEKNEDYQPTIIQLHDLIVKLAKELKREDLGYYWNEGYQSPAAPPAGKRIDLDSAEPPKRLSPFNDLVKELCVKDMRPLLEREVSPLEKIAYEGSGELSKQFVGELKKAHDSNLDENYYVYSLKENNPEHARRLEKAAKEKSHAFLDEARKLLGEIESIANFPTEEQFADLTPEKQEEVVSYRLKQQGLQTMKLTLRDPLLLSLLMRSGDELKKQNPFLDDAAIATLHKEMVQYFDLMNQKAQADAARLLLINARKKGDNNAFSKAVALLDHARRYDPYLYPEMAIYEYATGFQLRPGQVKLLKEIIDLTISGKNPERLKQLCFEFQAGGGKTKVLSAILAARILAEGKVPVFFSLPHLEEVSQEDLKEALSHVFQLRLTSVSFKTGDKIELVQVEETIEKFELALKEKKTLFMTPETWHCLNLARAHAIKAGEAPLVEAMDRLFRIMKDKGVALIDEGHLNADALHETNRASGVPRHIPQGECKIIARMARYLIEDNKLQRLVKLAQNKQSTMLATSLPRVKKRLAKLITKQFRRDIPENNRDSLRAYWLDPDAERPEWMKKIEEEAQQDVHQALLLKRIDLVRGLLNPVIPFTLSKTFELDYQKENRQDILIPAKQGTASKSHFQNPDVAAFTSAQGTFQNGLDSHQLDKVILHYIKEYNKELRLGLGGQSKAISEWMKIQEESGVDPEDRYYLSADTDRFKLILEHRKQLDKIANKVCRHNRLIEQYLVREVLPKVNIFPTVEQSTATNLVKAFDTAILFSATMGIHEKYPLKNDPEKSHKRDLQFMDHVMTRASLPQNSKMLWKVESTPKELLQELPEDEFSEVEGIINAGAFCEKATSKEWADTFLDLAKERNLDKRAALFFQNNYEGKRELCLKVVGDQPGDQPMVHKITGSDLKTVFDSLGLRADQVYKIFSPSETTGTDLPVSPKARMLLTVGDHVGLSLSVQSIMRMRGFIDPQSEQKLLWVATPDYKEKIEEKFAGTEVTPCHFFAYALEKDVENDIASIKQQAAQEIEAVIHDHVEFLRLTGKSINNHLNAYDRGLGRDPSLLYGGANAEVSTKDYLMAHAKNFALRAGFDFEKLPFYCHSDIKSIAERAANLVPTTRQRKGSTLNATMEQQVRVEQQQRQEQRAEDTQVMDLKPAHEVDHFKSRLLGLVHDTVTLFMGPILEHYKDVLYSPHKLVSAFFSEDLHFFINAFTTNPSEWTKPSRIKRAELFLVEEIAGVRHAFVASGYDVQRFIEQINNVKTVPEGRKICIFTAAGTLVKNGPPGANFTPDELKSLSDSTWMKDKICEIGLWNGKVVDRDWMIKRLKSTEKDVRNNCIQAWSVICDKHINKGHLDVNVMKDLIAETGISSDEIKVEQDHTADIADAAEYPELKPQATAAQQTTPQQRVKAAAARSTARAQEAAETGGTTAAKTGNSFAKAWKQVSELWSQKRWFKVASILTLGLAAFLAWLYFRVR